MSKSREDIFVKLMEYKLKAPIITWPGYEEFVMRDMKERIQLERFLVMEEVTEASEYEAMVYLHTASLIQPFSHSWYVIYTYLFSKFYPDKSKILALPKAQLDDQDLQSLKRLRLWLYRRQIEAMKVKPGQKVSSNSYKHLHSISSNNDIKGEGL